MQRQTRGLAAYTRRPLRPLAYFLNCARGSDASRKVWNVGSIGGRAFFNNYVVLHGYYSFPAFLRANGSANRRRACAPSALNA